MAAMEELFRPVPATIATRNNSSSCRKRSLADVSSNLDCDGIAKKMQQSFSAMAACKRGDSERCNRGSAISLPDSLHSVKDLDYVKDSTSTVCLNESRVSSRNDSLDLKADLKEKEEAPELRVLRWGMASRLAFMYEAGLLEWQRDASAQVQVTCEAAGYGKEQLCVSNKNRSGTNDSNDLRPQMAAKGIRKENDNILLLQAKQKEGFEDSKQECWATTMISMFSSINEEPVHLCPGLCNPSQLICKS